MGRLAVLAFVAWSCVGCASTMQAKSSGWLEVTTEDLRLRTNLGKRQAVALAEEAQRLGSAIIENEFPCASVHLGRKVDVTVVFDSAAPRGFYRPASTRLLDVQPQLVVYGEDLAGTTRLFVHELAHRLLAICLPDVPLWLHEGVASYYETSVLDDDELRLGFPPYMFVNEVDGAKVIGVATVLYKGEPITVLPKGFAPGFRELRMMSHSDFYAGGKAHSRVAHYAGAWVAVHMLEFASLDLQERFGRYLRSMRDGADSDRAWELAFGGVDVAGLYAEHVDAGRHDWAYRKVEVSEIAEPTVRELSRTEGALIRAELEDWQDPEGVTSATEWLAFARTESPDSTKVLLHVGALCEERGDPVCARSHFERALEAKPTDPDALAAILMWFGRHEDLWEEAHGSIVERVDALRANGKSAFHFATAAWWSSRLQDCGTALELAKQSIAVDRTNWLAHAIAGECSARLGDLPNALRAYRAAMALSNHQGGELALQLQRAIANIEFLLERIER